MECNGGAGALAALKAVDEALDAKETPKVTPRATLAKRDKEAAMERADGATVAGARAGGARADGARADGVRADGARADAGDMPRRTIEDDNAKAPDQWKRET